MTNQILKALENTLKNPERLEHLELHFSGNSDKLRGSTFDKDFVKNSVELIQYISKQLQHRQFEINKNESEVSICITNPNTIVGFSALIEISKLSKEEKEKIKWMERFGYQVRYIEKESKSTHSLMAIFRYENQELGLKTIFPGEYAPAFPNSAIQSKEEYQNSVKFWDKHVLIKA